MDRLQTAEPRSAARPPAHRLWSAVERAPGDLGRQGRQLPVALAWLPADEYTHLEDRWPDIADGPAVRDDGGGVVPHAEYCRRMERRLREMRESGLTAIRIAPLHWPEYVAWLDENREEADPAELRARYAADLSRDPARVIAWAPGRNEPCWCGSGRKYKKCCAAPGACGTW